MPALHTVALDYTAIPDEPVRLCDDCIPALIKHAPALTALIVSSPYVTDAAVDSICTRPLKRLLISGTSVTKHTGAHTRTACLKCLGPVVLIARYAVVCV